MPLSSPSSLAGQFRKAVAFEHAALIRLICAYECMAENAPNLERTLREIGVFDDLAKLEKRYMNLIGHGQYTEETRRERDQLQSLTTEAQARADRHIQMSRGIALPAKG